jgi:hypothetical protein
MTYPDGSPKIKSTGLTQDSKGNWIIVVMPAADPTLPEIKHAVPPSMNGFSVKIMDRKPSIHDNQRDDLLNLQ